ncbi:hypothetical protein [Actinokineospora iranica]|uniref:Uncharacterized protein n=1 Tax=Actinokineospora iranica TaxID=1271860 RepID=A0A1G6Q0Q0_9PSEU|nr:hypothetical protein [Actinokineospora iranica]SDC86042.1 hypothetical protein SAMN05216174_10532 [Actinokineospora iranica]
MTGAGNPQRKGFSELGPVWISAIAALLVAMTGAGFFVGKASETQAKPTTVTVTASAAPAPPSASGAAAATTPPTTTTSAKTTEPGVRFSGELVWGKFSLDFTEPRPLNNAQISGLSGNNLYSDGGGSVVEWKTDSTPTKDECARVAKANGSNQANGLVKGSRVCGLTPEGRVFRIDVEAVGSGGIVSQVTVWENTP